ncbi:hypothetical protein D9M68_18050 [compost metagenome]
MKTIIAIFALLLSATVNAANYSGNGVIFPDELSKDGLPEAIPCKIHNPPGFSKGLICTWLNQSRMIEEWNPETERNFRYSNQMIAKCRNGKCNTDTYKAGFYPDKIDALVSIWYYISESSDGKPVAYLFGTGPGFDGDAVSYREAGDILHAFYVEANLPMDRIMEEMDVHYEGGYAAWKMGTVLTEQKADGPVNEAYCSPQLDDSCFINGVQVPKADLSKHLPVVQESTVEAAGGFCDYPICYGKNGKPVGIKQY